jgi:hypothetical protein
MVYFKAAKLEAEELFGARKYILYKGNNANYERDYPELFMCDEPAYMPMKDGKEKHDLRVLALLFAYQIALHP